VPAALRALRRCQPPPLRTAPSEACKALLPSKAHRSQTAAPEQTQGLGALRASPSPTWWPGGLRPGARAPLPQQPCMRRAHLRPGSRRFPSLVLCPSRGGDDVCCLDGSRRFPGALCPNSRCWAFAQQVEDAPGQMYWDQEGAVAPLTTGSSDPWHHPGHRRSHVADRWGTGGGPLASESVIL